jgi:NadR type nicotinamide-nucleotide adenylyltransferase
MMNKRTDLRIAITGPESTGKTTLCRYLAEEYDTIYIPEYARGHLEAHGSSYDAADIPRFYKKQLDQELSSVAKTGKPLFIDTEFSNAAIWYRSKTGNDHEWIQEMLDKHRYDLYLLLKPDIEWEHDPLRENPEKSDHYFNEFLKVMDELKFNYRIISGSGEERSLMAKRAVDDLIEQHLSDTQ